MILKLTFDNPNPTVIPLNYQYYIGSWVYKVLEQGDADFARFLHETGYKLENGRRFKLFTFSMLSIPKFIILKESSHLRIESTTFGLNIHFLLSEALQPFIVGLFQNQELTIRSETFKVQQVECQPLEIKNASLRVRALSPIVISKKKDDGREEYLSPTHPEYESLFFYNLMGKYLSTGQNVPADWSIAIPALKVLHPDRVRSKLVTMKAGHASETKVKGYLFEFEMQAPAKLMETGLLAGFGKENSWGFGCGEVM